MESMRATWTDSRLDDFAAHTDRRFDAVDQRFDAVDRRLDHLDKDMRELRGEFGALQRAIVHLSIAVSGGFAAMVAAMIGVIATQL
jgi:predicted  nucleic acid-binding Zn-ribbon protein